MVAQKWTILIAATSCVQILACGTNEPGANQNEGDGGDASHQEITDLYPMAVGDTWVYNEKDVYNNTAVLRYEVTGSETIDFGHETGERHVFVLENTLPENPDETRIQYIEDDGIRAIRHRHLIYNKTGTLTKKRDFVPGFLRFDREKVKEGDSWTEELTRYTDTVDGSPIQTVTVKYKYEILAVSERITVEAGTFYCIRIKRSELFGNEIKEYYYAKGVGKVKEVTEKVKTEELVEYSLAPRQ